MQSILVMEYKWRDHLVIDIENIYYTCPISLGKKKDVTRHL
jgi:hypothetical protein